jgi:UDP-glucuronate 4-epimerase
MKHYLITGGAGFIGSHLIRNLLTTSADLKITCIDNFDPFYSADLKQLNIRDFKNNENFRFIYTDLADIAPGELCTMVPEPVDAIIHLAAKAGVRPSIEDPAAYQRVNIMGLQNLLDFAKAKEIIQFVFAGSSSVYGINNHYPWKEDEKLLPISPYAQTKLAGEMLGHVYHKLFGIRFIALRFFTVYGPGQRPDLAIHKFTRCLLNGKAIDMYGDGSTSRDYTYIDDIISGVTAAVSYTQSGFEIINLGDNRPVSLKEMIGTIEAITGMTAQINQMPVQPGDVPVTYADITKARQLFGYNPVIHLPEGISRFVEWYKANREIIEGTI